MLSLLSGWFLLSIGPLILIRWLRQNPIQRSHWAASRWVDVACLPLWAFLVDSVILVLLTVLSSFVSTASFMTDTLGNMLTLGHLLMIPFMMLLPFSLVGVPVFLWWFTHRQISQRQVDKVLVAQRKRFIADEKRAASSVPVPRVSEIEK